MPSKYQLRRTHRLSAVSLVLLFCAGAFGQAPRTIPAEITSIQIVGTHPNPEDESDLIVSLSVTVQAVDRPFVVPNCAEDESSPFFCVAQITRSNGKVVPVRKHLAATLGFLNQDQWKPLILQPGSQQTFRLAYSTRLLDVSAGEPLRVKLQVWPDANSMKDWKASTSLMTPIFRNPSKAR